MTYQPVSLLKLMLQKHFDQRQMAKDPANSIDIVKEDVAKINRRSKIASVYLVKDVRQS